MNHALIPPNLLLTYVIFLKILFLGLVLDKPKIIFKRCTKLGISLLLILNLRGYINRTKPVPSATTSGLNGPNDQSVKPTSKSIPQLSLLSSAHDKEMFNVQRRSREPCTTAATSMPAQCMTTTNRFHCLGSCVEVCYRIRTRSTIMCMT